MWKNYAFVYKTKKNLETLPLAMKKNPLAYANWFYLNWKLFLMKVLLPFKKFVHQLYKKFPKKIAHMFLKQSAYTGIICFFFFIAFHQLGQVGLVVAMSVRLFIRH